MESLTKTDSEKCIICGKDEVLTSEHVFPEYLGGSLKISAVCKPCNNDMGQTFEGDCAKSLLFGLPRMNYAVAGKAANPPNPFSKIGTLPDGAKIRLDDQFKPYLIPQVSEKELPDGSFQIQLSLDASDEKQIDEILTKKLRKRLQAQNSKISETELASQVKKLLEQAKSQISGQINQPTIKFSFAEDLGALTLQFIKIVYELAYHHFGYAYVNNSKTAETLRNAIKNKDTKPRIRGQILTDFPSLKNIFSDENCHYALMTNGCCYVQIFGNISGMVMFEESDPRFLVSSDEVVLYLINHQSGTWLKEKLNRTNE